MTEEHEPTSALYQGQAKVAAAEAQAQAAEALEIKQRAEYWNKPVAERRAESARIHKANQAAAKERQLRQDALDNLTAGRKVTQAQAQAVASYIREYENTIDGLKREIDGLKREIRGLNIDLDGKEAFLQRWVKEFNSIWRALEELAGCQFYEGSNGHGYRVIQGGQVIREIEGFDSIHDVLHAALLWWREYDGIPF